jgi:hypothetical protein
MLHPVAIVIMGGGFLVSLYLALAQAKVFLLELLVIFHLAMYLIGFQPEARRAEEHLRELLS